MTAVKFDRSAFKTGRSLAQQEKELEKKKPARSSDGAFKTIDFKEDGEYLIRFWPQHPGTNTYFLQEVLTHWIDINKPKKDKDGKVIEGEFEVGRGTVLSGLIHSNAGKDLINEYINFAWKLAKETHGSGTDEESKKARKKFMYPMTEDFKTSIKASKSFAGYASLLEKQADGSYREKDFGLTYLKPYLRQDMIKMLAGEDGEDGGIAIDPFTDPDAGNILKVTKVTHPKGSTEKALSIAQVKKSQIPVNWPLPEGFEERYSSFKSLEELFINVYSAKDFNKSLEGLQRFDSINKYGIFEYDDFLDTVEELSKLYDNSVESVKQEEEPEEKEVEEKPEIPVEIPSTKSEKVTTAPFASTSSDTANRLAEMKAKMGKK